MSQFKLQKVTKVKGPSELSMVSSETAKKSSRTVSSTSTDRPQTQPRQKKSTSKPAEDKQTSSEKTTTGSGSRLAPKTRATATKRTTSKTCPSQQSKRSGLPQTASKQTKTKPSNTDTTKKYSTPDKSHILLKQTSKPTHKPPEETNEYHGSGSDSDENELSGKLSPKDDVGYETGSFDEVDASSSDATSPAGDNYVGPSYSYADLEFRPLIVTEEGGISAPIDTRHSDTPVDSTQERLSYAYAGDEFRPLIVTDSGGVVGPVNLKKSREEIRVPQPTAYEEVEIHGGRFDRANANVVQLFPSTTEKDSIEDFSIQKPEQNSRQQGFNVVEGQRAGDVYACVQKDRNKSAVNSKTNTEEIPPEIPSRKDITRSDLYEHITGQLQNMIQDCDDNTLEAPPPIPQPYSGPGILHSEEPKELEVVDLDEDLNGMPLYAAVQKKPKDKFVNKKQPQEVPPPLPSRSNLIDISPTVQGEQTKQSTGIFKKKHRRNVSEGNFIHHTSGHPLPELQADNNHRRSKSQADITTPFSKEKNGSGNVVKPYLEVDITEPPNTPTDFKGARHFEEEDNGDLPEGWKEVESDGTKYYWHVSSGTTQWERPLVAPRQKRKSSEPAIPSQQGTEKQKVLSFPIHSMGWIELEENQVAPHNMSDTISECISSLAKARKDLWQTSETWGEGKDIRLLLEGDTLKLVEPRNKVTLLVQPVSKMRVWGVGKEDHRDFAYVARDPNTSKHKCHMFRCHGNISGRAITTALHEMCNRILEEKKRAQENGKKNAPKPWSDIINTPAAPSAKDNAGFNEKPVREQRKDFTAAYLGCTDVPKPTGMEMLNRAICKVASRGGPKRTVLIQVTVSCIKLTDCTSQEEIAEDRVRYLTFMGIGKDDRLCGYVMASEPDRFLCHVFQCSPNAAALTKALEEACQLRYQKCLDAYPEMAAKAAATQEPEPDKSKDKSNFISSVQGLFGKLGAKKGLAKKDDSASATGLPKPNHTFMVKYYGALPVAVGTGVETVEEAAKHLTGGTLLICQLDVAINGVTLYDSQRSTLSRRHMDADTISYCGLTSDSGHFGLIQCQGGGKYVCHVFSEYKTRATPIVAAIHETL